MKKALVLFLCLVILSCSTIIIKDFITDHQAQRINSGQPRKEPNATTSSPPQPSATPTPSNSDAPPPPTPKPTPTFTPEAEEKFAENPDFTGWLEIPAINLSLLVVRTPKINDTESPYLSCLFNGKPDGNGTLYESASTESDHRIIFGHHMKNGLMFGDLEKFKKPEFIEQDPTIIFTDLYGNITTYKIHLSYYVINNPGKTYTDFFGIKETHVDENSIRHFVQDTQIYGAFLEQLDTAYYKDPTFVPSSDQKMITLVTCDYAHDKDNERLIISAVAIDEQPLTAD